MYLTELTTALVEALKETFDEDYPNERLRDIFISTEWPSDNANYPGIWVNFEPTGQFEVSAVGGGLEYLYEEDPVTHEKVFHTFTMWRSQGLAAFTVVALTHLEFARIFDEVARVMAFGREKPETSTFRAYVEENDFVAINLDFDQIGTGGFAISEGTPWGTDDVVWEGTLTMEVVAEFYSDGSTQALVPLRQVVFYPEPFTPPNPNPALPGTTPSFTSVTESFNQSAEWPIGPDQTWVEGHSGYGLSTQVNSDGSVAAQRTLHVIGNSLTVKAPDDSLLTGGDSLWTGAQGLLRATGSIAQDMMVAATVTAEGPAAPQYLLLARSGPHPDEDLPHLIALGYLAFFESGQLQVDVRYDSGGSLSYSSIVSPMTLATLLPGDVISLAVTGTGSGTSVVAAVNGLIVAIGSFSISTSLLPLGTQAGCGLVAFGDMAFQQWTRANCDDKTRLDNWQAGPA